MKIIKLEAENIRRLEAVSIEPDGSLVVVGGDNGHGKSSVLDAIWYALGGAKALPPEPLRRGARLGRTRLDLGELVVERVINENGSFLEVKKPDGYLAPSPQAILDELCGKLAFDPLGFIRLRPKDQLETLRGLVGLDFIGLDDERAAAYATRTSVNREAKQVEAELKALPNIPADTPEQPISLEGILNDMRSREAVNAENAKQRQALERLKAKAADGLKEKQSLVTKIKQLRDALAELEPELEKLDERIANGEQVCAGLVDQSLEECRAQIRESEETNRHVRNLQQRKHIQAKHLDLVARSQKLTQRIEAIDAEKAHDLEAAQFPVAGLELRDDGVYFNDLPLQQASSAEQLRISAAIGLALNPTLRVMVIRDGSLLDAANLELLRELAEQHDAQIWIERVSTGDEVSVVIEEGKVKRARSRKSAPEAVEAR